MDTSPNPRREHPSTYFVQDRSNLEEMERLRLQDRMTTMVMGGLLPEQASPPRVQRVLDVACGTGGWLIEMAKAYPDAPLLIGVDVSGRMVHSAREQAEAQGVSDRVEFHVMDALRMLEFPTSYFDLVNQRFGLGYLRTWDWPKLLQEFHRVTRVGGMIRLTEGDFAHQSSSPALLRLSQLLAQALAQAGHLFDPESRGVANDLARLLQKHGGELQQIQTRTYTLEYRAGTAVGQLFAEDMRHAFRTALPFLRKWLHDLDDYEDLYQQLLQETQQPDFSADVNTVTAWGIRAPAGVSWSQMTR